MFFAARSFGSIAGQGSVNLGELVGQRMPGFKSSSVLDGCLCDLDSQEYFKDSYGLLVFYPLDFTFVCPSELLGISERLSDFEKRGVKVVGVSVDSPFSHLAWSQMELKKGGIEGIKFPLVSDVSRSITKSFGLMRPEGFAQRASVLIDKQGMVRHVAVFDLGIGRSVDEMLRMFDAIQHFDASGQVCPANWQKGRDAMSPSATSTGEYLHKTYQKA
ncbi:antioxidant, AhpC/TSA family [Babesia divergens]|uniref:Antioxidant, AhpC/TSA family n=1 Tax=Babesia divergens TaxID=32595 RepID=A0AAD9GFW6_BABDI|nr:antioxidant, AhpC/TSA family [Babesia divergens]